MKQLVPPLTHSEDLSPKFRSRAGQSQGIPFAHTSSSRSFLYDSGSLPPCLWMWFLSVLTHMVPFTLSFITTTSAKPVHASRSLACHNKVCSQPWQSRQTPKGQMTTSPCNSWIQNLSLGILAPLFSSLCFLTFNFFWEFYMWILYVNIKFLCEYCVNLILSLPLLPLISPVSYPLLKFMASYFLIIFLSIYINLSL